MSVPKREQVGVVGVDAGCLMVGDPCYFINDPGSKTASSHLTWKDCCDMMAREDGGPVQLDFEAGHEGLGVIVGTTHGDGCYPVFVETYARGRRRLVVDLD